jgi:hypothetical protein
VPGSGYSDADAVLEADADIIGHINDGQMALPLSPIRCPCEGCSRAIEIVHNGNELAGLTALRYAREPGQMERVILGIDSPAGSGVQWLGTCDRSLCCHRYGMCRWRRCSAVRRGIRRGCGVWIAGFLR